MLILWLCVSFMIGVVTRIVGYHSIQNLIRLFSEVLTTNNRCMELAPPYEE